MTSSTSFDYEFDAQEVCKGVFVGSSNAAHVSEEILVEHHNIRFVLVCGMGLFMPHSNSARLTYKKLKWLDHPSYSIASELSDVVEFIANARQSDSAVLVHCSRGMSRSVSAAIAYMMSVDDSLSFDDALAIVKSKRPIAEPNEGFEQDLRAWIQAQRSDRALSRDAEKQMAADAQ